MTLPILRTAVAGLALAGLLVGCQSVQTTAGGAVGIERTQRMSPLVSETQLREQAELSYREALAKERQQGKLNADPALTARVRAIAGRLIPAAGAFRPEATRWNWEVNVIRSDEMNAWCMPGGKIAVYTGLITKLGLNDDEIAAIVGHEIAHALREHARERASEQLGAQVLLSGAVMAIGGGQASMDLGGLFYKTFFGLPNSRLHETEADRIGVELAARAGYDPRAAISLWRKMTARGGSGVPEFLSTHPAADTRIADLEVYSARVMPLYEQARRER
ncbi:M48 family metallopeptidase [Burkholderiaceae bacterium FT117]|uniref:M48 family metallopeptidase n=1 Tax=Zeimonas sediminis TaxID=2944268 RepID=UPI0023430825|nr:M48 family metallopeptidase [Zeimonas sediminis]MCM5569554.1 M48 family metallopeptidase [Zeimonas sediminis]